MKQLLPGSIADRGSRVSRLSVVRGLLVVAIALAAVWVATSMPAMANHTFDRWQQDLDAGSCCVQVRGHTQTSPGANIVSASILKSGTWYQATCSNCNYVFSVWRTYSYPVTVKTSHFYDAGGLHADSSLLSVYYP